VKPVGEPDTGMSGSMSGDGKRSVGHRPQATAPILDSTRIGIGQALQAVPGVELVAGDVGVDLAAGQRWSCYSGLESIEVRDDALTFGLNEIVVDEGLEPGLPDGVAEAWAGEGCRAAAPGSRGW